MRPPQQHIGSFRACRGRWIGVNDYVRKTQQGRRCSEVLVLAVGQCAGRTLVVRAGEPGGGRRRCLRPHDHVGEGADLFAVRLWYRDMSEPTQRIGAQRIGARRIAGECQLSR